jgi:excinuclease ABC subunit A
MPLFNGKHMPAKKYIFIKGAAAHNLKDVDVKIPRDQLVVITGVSGSGKSTLAFDTLYAEGQRRYVESLSAYARQFLGQMDKPEVEYIEGLSPAIAIEQKSASKNPRSTVATVTEIHDYLRLLYARAGDPHCYKCGQPIAAQAPEQMADELLRLAADTKLYLMAPVVVGRKGQHKNEFERLRRQGFARVVVDGGEYELEDEIKLDKNKKHTIYAVVDRLVMKAGLERRLADSLETALELGEGAALARIFDAKGFEDRLFSRHFACSNCNISYPEISPRLFSFNSPYGMCPSCGGLGFTLEVDEELVVPDDGLSLNEGAILPYRRDTDSYIWQYLENLARQLRFDLDAPWRELPESVRDVLLYGSEGRRFRMRYEREGRVYQFVHEIEGVIPRLKRLYRDTQSEEAREFYYGRFFRKDPCPACGGARLRPEALAVTVGGKNIAEVCELSVSSALHFFENLELAGNKAVIAKEILKELAARLGFLVDVGLEYLTLERTAPTLSGGEAQRIRLATQVGSGLVGVTYILDEPTIGLHKRDNERLLKTLYSLRDLGNTVVVVEHDEQTIRAADHVIDLGPGAGIHGGLIVAEGPPERIQKSRKSVTGRYLRGDARIPTPETRRAGNGSSLALRGARHNNLKTIDVSFPLGAFACVTGVSGSGKSSLIAETLYPVLQRRLYRSPVRPGAYDDIEGLEYVDKVIQIDQQPIGRTPRSNPATYTKVFDPIRRLFGELPESKARGYKPGRFSFNVRGGRCDACDGDGIIKVEMHFLPDVYIPCEVCKGKRYNRETLEVKYKGMNIADVLAMTVEEALSFFDAHPRIKKILETLYDVGLGYIELGQPAPTLSGGEAQRVKLSRELAKRATGRTVYFLDEPTTGLHFDDVKKLLAVLQRLVDAGNTVIVVEHNLDVIKNADYVIDLGPGGGDDGGHLVAAGTPEDVSRNRKSFTGKYLRTTLAKK